MNFKSNKTVEEELEKLPDEVAHALLNWRKSTLDREVVEARLYRILKSEKPDATATELKHAVNESNERYEAVAKEITLESIYTAKYETLMDKKLVARMRVAI